MGAFRPGAHGAKLAVEMAIDEGLMSEAVAGMKAGHSPEAAYGFLVSRGATPQEAHAAVDQLVALKRRADAANPQRLRDEAQWMLIQGATNEQVVAKFVSVGVADLHARPEVERIAAVVRTMRPCDRCRAPIKPTETFFDMQGGKICARCNASNEIAASERRGMASTFEAVGINPLFAEALSGAVSAEARAPVCGQCGTAGTHVSYIDPAARASMPPQWSYVCQRCMRAIA